MSALETLRVLIWGKTYPELSARHAETVCTGAVTADGAPIRLYPVPFRFLDGAQQYSLFDWVDVQAARNPSDTRPESRKIVPESLRVVGRIPSNPSDGWRARSEVLFRDPAWQFTALSDLLAAQQATGRSMGVLRVGRVVDARSVRRSATDRREYESKRDELIAQGDLFRPPSRELDFLEHEVKVRFHCAAACTGCAHRPHDMKVMNWGVQELLRREGIDAAVAKVRAITDLRTHDLQLFMGNFRLHPQTFGIIGLWYPPIPAQPLLL